MMLPTDAAMTTRRNSLGGTFGALVGGMDTPLVSGDFPRPSPAPPIGAGRGSQLVREENNSGRRPQSRENARRPSPLPPVRLPQRAATRFLRATPVRTAASATADETAGTRRASNIVGVMYSSLSSALPTML